MQRHPSFQCSHNGLGVNLTSVWCSEYIGGVYSTSSKNYRNRFFPWGAIFELGINYWKLVASPKLVWWWERVRVSNVIVWRCRSNVSDQSSSNHTSIFSLHVTRYNSPGSDIVRIWQIDSFLDSMDRGAVIHVRNHAYRPQKMPTFVVVMC